MSRVSPEPLLFCLADPSIVIHLADNLQMIVDQFERCQKALADFLEDKRSKILWFYFTGDDDLLEILGQATNPSVIQNHLKNLLQAAPVSLKQCFVFKRYLAQGLFGSAARQEILACTGDE